MLLLHIHARTGSVVLSTPFQVGGFSMSGRVVDPEGKPIAGAAIKVNGADKGVTDAAGYVSVLVVSMCMESMASNIILIVLHCIVVCYHIHLSLLFFPPCFNLCRSYKLEQLKSGTYSIEAVKEHVTFNNLVSFKISPNTPTLPDITVKRYVLNFIFILFYLYYYKYCEMFVW